MKHAFLFLIFMSWNFSNPRALGQDTSGQQPDSGKPKHLSDTIKWSPDYKLTFNDFQQTRFDATNLEYERILTDSDSSININAYSALQIGFSFKMIDRKIIVDAHAVFYKSKSWMRLKKESSLIHEQGHFDITELYARKFKKRMEAHQDDRDLQFWEIFHREYDDINKQHLKEQLEYDAISRGGPLNEKFYLEKIARELKSSQ